MNINLGNGKENRILLFPKNQTVPDMSDYGFVVPSLEEISFKDKAFVCLMKGFLIFAVTMGCLGGLISSFDINCNRLEIIIVIFFLSMITALLRVQRLVFDLGYPILFVLFLMSITSSYRLVNSGYQTFLSILQKSYSDYYGLSIVRENEGINYDPAVSMTYAAIFIGFAMILLLNMVISEHMSLWMTILMTFPIFQLGIYIGKYPSFLYLFMLLFGYFFIGVWKFSGHFQIPMTKRDQTIYKLTTQEQNVGYHYRIHGKSVFQLTGVILILAGFTSIMLFATQSSEQMEKKVQNNLRKSIDNKLEILTQNGILGLFDRYDATGGLSEGKLGGVSSVRPDYEADLQITMVPYSLDSIYLKAYTGAYYTGNSWEAVYPKHFSNNNAYVSDDAFTAKKLLDAYEKRSQSELLSVRCRVNNLDANTNYLYLPYYPKDMLSVNYDSWHGLLKGDSFYNKPYEFWYYPESVLKNYMEEQGKSWDFLYVSHPGSVFDQVYLDVPDNIKKDLLEIMDQIGYAKTTTGQIELIQNYFAENYTYSMSPGSTPTNQDVATYFLKNQKRGYCAHFATAATLLLREYGIPARYVEGYCFSPLEVVGSVNEEENADDWITKNDIFSDASVVTMEVSDAQAHSWVEVYYEEFGWVPYEFTVGQVEETSTAGSDFFSVFSDFFSDSDEQKSGNYDTSSLFQNNDMTFGEISKEIVRSVLKVVVVIAFILVLFYGLSKVRRYLRMRLQFQKGQYEAYLSFLLKKVIQKEKLVLHENGRVPLEGQDEPIKNVYDIMDKCFFSEYGITKQEAKEAVAILKYKLRRRNLH